MRRDLVALAMAVALGAPGAVLAQAPPLVATELPARLRETQRVAGEAERVLAEPAGVLGDAFGRVWVSDASLHKLRRWDAAGKPLDETGALGSEPGQFRRPGPLARLGSLGVAVLDVENQRVATYDHHLRLLGVVVDLAAPALADRIGRVRALGLAADRGGALYVADADRDRVLVFDFAGQYLRELGGFSPRAGGFSGLQGLACGPRGRLVTVERPRARGRRAAPGDSAVGRSRIQWLDPGGRVTGTGWTPAWSAGSGETWLSVAVDDSNRVAVAGERSGELWLFSAEGAVLARFTDLAAPRALAFAQDGSLLVAEAGAGRVRRLVLEPAARE